MLHAGCGVALMSTKPIIFIGYAHADEPAKPVDGEVQWLTFVPRYLQPAVKGGIDLWVDRRMMRGVNWDPEIEQKLRGCERGALMSLQDWRAPPSGPDRSSYDSSGQASAVQSGPGWSRDIKNLFLVIFLIAAIGGAIYERIIRHRQHAGQPSETSKNAPASTPSPLYPWCPPERDECWR